MGPIEREISNVLQALDAKEFTIENESHRHKNGPGAETHFKLLVVWSGFEGLTAVQRHRVIYDRLASWMKPGGIHALSMQLQTPTEREEKASSLSSPACQGGDGRVG